MNLGATLAMRGRFAALLCAIAGCSEARSSADLGGGGHAGAPPVDATADVATEPQPGDGSAADAGEGGADAADDASEPEPDVTGPCGQTPLERALIDVASEAAASAAGARLDLVRACAAVATKLELEVPWTCCEPPSDSVLLSTCKVASHAIRVELGSEPRTQLAIPALPCAPAQAASAECRTACRGGGCEPLCAVLESTEAACPTPSVSVGATSVRFVEALFANGAGLVRVNTWLSGVQGFAPPHVATDQAASRLAGARRVCSEHVAKLARAAVSFDAARGASAEVLTYLGLPLPR